MFSSPRTETCVKRQRETQVSRTPPLSNRLSIRPSHSRPVHACADATYHTSSPPPQTFNTLLNPPPRTIVILNSPEMSTASVLVLAPPAPERWSCRSYAFSCTSGPLRGIVFWVLFSILGSHFRRMNRARCNTQVRATGREGWRSGTWWVVCTLLVVDFYGWCCIWQLIIDVVSDVIV